MPLSEWYQYYFVLVLLDSLDSLNIRFIYIYKKLLWYDIAQAF